MKNSGWVVGRPVLLIVAWMYGALAAGADDRLLSPVPDAVSLEAAEKLVRDVFAEEHRAAKTNADKTALAKKILGVAAQSGNGSAEQFVVFRAARNIAALASDAETALEAVEGISGRFRVDALQMRVSVLEEISGRARFPSVHKALLTHFGEVFDEAMGSGRFDVARQVQALAMVSAVKTRDYIARKETAAWLKQLVRLEQQSAAMKQALGVLEERPTDTKANLLVGKYRCFSEGDWGAGLPMLALGSDAALAALARRELRPPTDPRKQAALADAWWDAGMSAADVDQNGCRRRARHWYRTAGKDAEGLLKVKIQKRLEMLGDLKDPPLLARNKPADVAGPEPRLEVAEVKMAPRFDAGKPITAQLIGAIELVGHSAHVHDARFSNDGALIVTRAHGFRPGEEQAVRVWNGATGELIRAFENGKDGFDGAGSATMSPDGKLLVAVPANDSRGLFGDRLVLFDTTTGEARKSVLVAGLRLSAKSGLQFTPDGKWLVASVDRSWAIFDTSDWKLKTEIKNRDQVRSLAITDQSIVASRFGKESIVVWHIETGDIDIELPVDRLTGALSVSPDGKLLAGSSNSNEIGLYDLEKWHLLGVLRAQMGSPLSTDFSPRGRLLASGDAGRKLILWDVGTRQKLQEIPCNQPVNIVRFSPDGGRLVSTQIDGKVLLWTVQARQPH